MTQFVMATKNLKKLAEMVRILEPIGVRVICEKDLPVALPEVVEDGESFESNALIKARSACSVTGLPALADDSGLCVDALGGAPGIYSARFAGEPCDDNANNLKLLEELKNVPTENRTARYVSVIACVFPDGREFTVRGECEGSIAFDMIEGNGFGYDVLFISEIGRISQISDSEKDSISHRGNSLKKLVSILPDYIKEENIC